MGMKTTTVKVNGLTHQVRRVPCGKAEQCKTCKEHGGHVAVYVDTGAAGGARWKYVGKQLPAADPDYQQPSTCQREGCTNSILHAGQKHPRHNRKYCSDRCRVAANRAK